MAICPGETRNKNQYKQDINGLDMCSGVIVDLFWTKDAEYEGRRKSGRPQRRYVDVL